MPPPVVTLLGEAAGEHHLIAVFVVYVKHSLSRSLLSFYSSISIKKEKLCPFFEHRLDAFYKVIELPKQED
jgi:hypothetical protein